MLPFIKQRFIFFRTRSCAKGQSHGSADMYEDCK